MSTAVFDRSAVSAMKPRSNLERLRLLLEEYDITPLNEAKRTQHMAKVATRTKTLHWVAFICCALLTLIFCGFCVLAGNNDSVLALVGACMATIGAAFATLLAACLAAFTQVVWRWAPYDEYAGQHHLPSAVTEMVGRLRAADPRLRFMVRYTALDPLLRVTSETDSLYIAAWEKNRAGEPLIDLT